MENVMTPEQLVVKVEELEALIQSGKDYEQAEITARELLTSHSAGKDKGEDIIRCRILLAFSESLWRRGMAKEALPVAEQALALAERAESKEQQAKAWNTIGNVLVNLSDYTLALEYYAKAIATHEELGDNSGAARVNGNIGLIYSNLSDNVRALEYLCKALAVYDELGDKSGAARVTGNIGNVFVNLSDYPHALEYFGKALAAHEELGDNEGTARAINNIGLVQVNLSDYPRALEYFGKSLVAHKELGNKHGEATVTGNIGSVYSDLSDYPRALEYFGKSLAAHEELADKHGAARVTGNIGNVFVNLSDYSLALEYFGKSLIAHEELGNKSGAAIITGNIGLVYQYLSDYPRALEYYAKALAAHEELGDKHGAARVTGNIGSVYAAEEFEGYNPEKAEELLLKALESFVELGAKLGQYSNHKSLSDLYEKQGRIAEAIDHFKKYHGLKEEVQSEEARKKAELMEQRRHADEREKQLAVERARAQATLELLHNTLPPEIADRLLAGETFIADHYEAVSVLFMDLVNFTRITATIPPRHLIYLLNAIFTAADKIMQNHGLEKIKTIGDAYMAVAGAPSADEFHAAKAAAAALDLLDAMNNLSVEIPTELGRADWVGGLSELRVRIGLHCGAAVGGIIGNRKYTFDLWGDAVNTAARMESHGEAGKIHCSEEFVQALTQRDLTQTLPGRKGISLPHSPYGEGLDGVLIERGEVEIKGKGKMRTYFLEKVKP